MNTIYLLIFYHTIKFILSYLILKNCANIDAYAKKDVSFHIQGILENNMTNLNFDSSWIDGTN